jgi:predicted RNase H-like HicB family nuclease
MNPKKKVLGFQVVVYPEDDGFSVVAPELGIADQGDTEAEALASLKEGIELHLECLTATERKELKKKMSERKFIQLKIQMPA